MCAKILESVYHCHCGQSKLQQHIATHNNVHENVYCIFVCICHSCLKWNFIHFAWTKFTVHTSLLRWTKIYLYVCVFFSTLSLSYTHKPTTTTTTFKKVCIFFRARCNVEMTWYIQHHIRCKNITSDRTHNKNTTHNITPTPVTWLKILTQKHTRTAANVQWKYRIACLPSPCIW